MNTSAIIHRSALTDCYMLDKDTAVLNIRTGKDVTAVNIVYEDPYAYGISGEINWIGKVAPMTLRRELRHCFIWTVQLHPAYKRLQYYFELFCGEETLLLLEDDFYTQAQLSRKGRWKQYFKLPWMNPSDVITVPDWVEETVWYQIMPDRFCRGSALPKRMPLKAWNDRESVGYDDFYGGDLAGIIQKLPYLKALGVTGIYLLPLFLSDSNHKYNISDYETIDPDFGTEAELIELVDTAHRLGMRVMLDAVFNHSGTGFFAWQDVWEHGEKSPYFDWFCINTLPFERKYASLRDGRFYGFAFLDNMPKLNTCNPKVTEYCIGRCKYWIENWHIDGIRFDVGNEVSHTFLKTMHQTLKAVKPDLFLLGEIWHDSVQWLQGDEYDSVMNYPFFESMHNFWLDEARTSRDFMFAMNRVYSLYPEQVNRVIFNFLDTHDTLRARNRCGSLDVLYQQLTVLMTMPGSACIYYGTELAMSGSHDPDCRRTMPWDEIENGVHDDAIREMKKLIALRKEQPAIRGSALSWHHDAAQPRLVCYTRPAPEGTITVYLNAAAEPVVIPVGGTVCYSRKYKDGVIEAGGVLVLRT